MRTKIIALIMVFLILTTSAPYVHGQSGRGIFGTEEDVGEAIVINVDKYEPKIVRSSLLEQQDVPVYVFVKGTTLGGLLGQEDSDSAPLFGLPRIKDIRYWTANARSSKLVSGITPIFPRDREFPVENGFIDLGYLIVNLRRIDKESDLSATNDSFPFGGAETIDVDVKALVRFDLESSVGTFGAKDIVVKEEVDEDRWKQDPGKAFFFGQSGAIRADNIGDDFVNLQIYDGFLRSLAGVTLREGEVSRFMRVRDAGLDAIRDFFRVRLNEIRAPEDKVTLEIQRDGSVENVVLAKGMRLYPGSRWKVKEIRPQKIVEEKGTRFLVDEVLLVHDNRQQKIIRRKYSESSSNESASANSIDLCGSVTPYSSSDLVKNDKPIDVKSLDTKRLYCTAIDELESFTMGHPESSFANEAYFYLGESYRGLAHFSDSRAAYQHALDAYQQIKGGRLNILAKDKIVEVEHLLQQNVVADTVFLGDLADDSVQEKVYVKIQDIKLVSLDDRPSVFIRIDGGKAKEFTVISGDAPGSNTKLFSSSDSKGRQFSWVVNEITRDRVTIKQVFSDSSIRGRVIDLRLNKLEKIPASGGDTRTVEVINIDSKEEAYITVLPGSGKAISEGEFTLHIPVETRAIKFTPEQIDWQINKTRSLIKKIDGIVETLDTWIKWGKAGCFAVWSFITLKNLFGGSSLAKARGTVMSGVDGQSGWNLYCQENNKQDGKEDAVYDTFEQCIFDNRGSINKEIQATRDIVKTVQDIKDDNILEEIKKNKLFGDVKELEDPSNLALPVTPETGTEYIFDSDDIRERVHLEQQLQVDKDIIENLREEGAAAKRVTAARQRIEDIEKELKVLKNNMEKRIEDHLAAKEALEKAERNAGREGAVLYGLNKGTDEYRLAARRFYDRRYAEKSSGDAIPNEGILKVLGAIDVRIVRTGEKGTETSKASFEQKENGVYLKKDLAPVTAEDYRKALEKKGTDLEEKTDPSSRQLLGWVKKELTRTKSMPPDQQIVTGDGKTIYQNDDKFYISNREAFAQGRRDSYSPEATAEFYPNGRPYCIPTEKGNYVKVLEYFRDGSPKTLQEWNVGPDGLICDEDDILITHNSYLERPEKQSLLNQLTRAATRSRTCKEGEVYDNKFRCSYSRARSAQRQATTHCTDVMGVTDCTLLFNICDPVMCPVSRFNLGGKWPVDNVVQTGIVGSLILGWNNYGPSKGVVVPPVCLPGISGGLKSMRSVLQGYEQCLQVSKDTGKTVGICNKIQSVFTCELLWREAYGIMSLPFRLLGFGASQSKHSGGGEYLGTNVRDSIDSVSQSASFFVNDYGQTSFSAYKARSTSDIGTQICRAAFFGQGPSIGEFLNDVTAPENPPQATAFFDEIPFSESAGQTVGNLEGQLFSRIQKQSEYSVFYHIYAGEDRDVRYQVFLKDDLGNIAYVTGRRGGAIRSFVKRGEFTSETVDFLGRSGFNQICIELNGQVFCGFGKVGTSFALNKLNDLYVESESNKKITSEDQCVPEHPRTSGVSILSGGFARTGIVRVCSIDNPGAGTNSEDWSDVGTCGKDEQGRDIGRCWVDKRTIDIKDLSRRDSTLNELNRQGRQPDIGLDSKKASKSLKKLNSAFRTAFTFGDLLQLKIVPDDTEEDTLKEGVGAAHNLIGNFETTRDGGGDSYRYLSVVAPAPVAEESLLRIGQIYYVLGEWKKDYDVATSLKEEKRGERSGGKGKKSNTIKQSTLPTEYVSGFDGRCVPSKEEGKDIWKCTGFVDKEEVVFSNNDNDNIKFTLGINEVKYHDNFIMRDVMIQASSHEGVIDCGVPGTDNFEFSSPLNENPPWRTCENFRVIDARLDKLDKDKIDFSIHFNVKEENFEFDLKQYISRDSITLKYDGGLWKIFNEGDKIYYAIDENINYDKVISGYGYNEILQKMRDMNFLEGVKYLIVKHSGDIGGIVKYKGVKLISLFGMNRSSLNALSKAFLGFYDFGENVRLPRLTTSQLTFTGSIARVFSEDMKGNVIIEYEEGVFSLFGLGEHENIRFKFVDNVWKWKSKGVRTWLPISRRNGSKTTLDDITSDDSYLEIYNNLVGKTFLGGLDYLFTNVQKGMGNFDDDSIILHSSNGNTLEIPHKGVNFDQINNFLKK